MHNKSIGIFGVLDSLGGWKVKAIKLFDLIVGSFLARIFPAKSGSGMIAGPIKKILVIRPGGIGDAIFLLPLLRSIKNQNPDLQVDILCEARNSQVFQSQGSICNQIYCYDQGFWWRELFGGAYDVIIDTEQWHYLSALVSYFLPSRVNAGFASRQLRSKLFNCPVAYDQNAYEMENFKNLFLPFFPDVRGVVDVRHSFDVDEETLKWARRKVPSGCIALFLGASVPLKRLDFNQNISLINILLAPGMNSSIILLGGADVRDEGERLSRHFNNSRILNFVAKTSLEQSAALIKCSRLLIGPDSGLIHLASAVGIPVFAIFGPSNIQKWGPKGADDKILSLKLECSPCSQYSYTLPTCHRSYKCMKSLDMNKVADILAAGVFKNHAPKQ